MFMLRRKATKEALRRRDEDKHRQDSAATASNNSQIPKLPQLGSRHIDHGGRASPMPSLRFSGLGLDHLMSNHGLNSSGSDFEDFSKVTDGAARQRYLNGDHLGGDSSGSSGESREEAQVQRSDKIADIVLGLNLASPTRSNADRSNNQNNNTTNTKTTNTTPSRIHALSSRNVGSSSLHPDSDSDSDSTDDYGEDDSQSIEAVRNLRNRRSQSPPPRIAPSRERSVRKSISQPEFDRSKVLDSAASIMTAQTSRSRAPAASKPPTKPSVSTILESARKVNLNQASKSSNPPISSPPSYEPPIAPSLFAYQNTSKMPRKLKDSGASIHSTATRKTVQRKTSVEHATIRNARGEIEWKHGPPPSNHMSTGVAQQHQAYQAQHRTSNLGSPERKGARSASQKPERPARRFVSSRDSDERASHHDSSSSTIRPKASTSSIPFKSIGTASQEPRPRRPRPGRRSTDDADGFQTADEDEFEALEWERKWDVQMETDRREIHQKQSLAVQKANRLAREKAEREEAEARKRDEEREIERRQRQREEAEARKRQEEKEAEERKIRRAKEAEERKIRRQKEAEERRLREEEEAKKRAEQEIARREAKRLAAIEAKRLAEQAAIKAQQDAILEKARRLADAKRQVEEEDRAARRAGRREERLAQRALAAGFPPGHLGSSAHEHEDDISEGESEAFVDADDSNEADAEGASAMARSTSNLDAPSSTDGSSDMPTTPADERSMNIAPSSLDMNRQASLNNGGEVRVKFAPSAPLTKTAESVAPYKPDRFRYAVRSGARRNVPAWTPTIRPDLRQPESTEEDDEIVQPNGPYREGGITYGRGWSAHGLADPSLVVDRRRYVRVQRPKPTKAPVAPATRSSGGGEGTEHEEEGDSESDSMMEENAVKVQNKSDAETKDGKEEEEETEEPIFDEVMYSDLGELIWSATTPDVIARLVSHLDYADIKALRQTSHSIRFALGQLAGREIVLTRFLAPIGYQPWKPAKIASDPDPNAPIVHKDPFPLSFSDCEAFLLSFDLLPEYHLVGAAYARAPHKMDPRYPRLARATARAYNRVLTRLRMQPDFCVPQMTGQAALSPHYPQGQMLTPNDQTLNRSPSPNSLPVFTGESSLASPWKVGRAGLYRTWVPSREAGGWLSDTELARCERELFIAGVWPYLKKGDVVWDCAVGDERNAGKYIFDGKYLRDLSFMFDRGGHLPSWLNAFSLPPSYYHNVIRSSDPSQPVVYLDVLPWRDQIVSTMRLVQDQVETFSPQGARYRISKWLYRAAFNVIPGQIISDEGLEVVDAGWHGRIVIETEGTAEHAKELISRCAGPAESAQTKARLLASVMDADGRPKVPKAPAPTRDGKGKRIQTTTPWAIVRARSRPGLIWIRPIDMRERVVF